MANFATAFKAETQRVARKEIRQHLEALRKMSVLHRREIAALKRSVKALEQSNKSLLKSNPRPVADANGADPSGDKSAKAPRFSAGGLRSLRARLELSAPELGQLLGVSSQSVYNWEQEKAKPRAAQVLAISEMRALGKRAARAKLEAQAQA